MSRPRGRALAAALLLSIANALGPMAATVARAAVVEVPSPGLAADLDGKAITLGQVGNHFCHDFAYPKIHCFSTARALEGVADSILAATAVSYVTMYDLPAFA